MAANSNFETRARKAAKKAKDNPEVTAAGALAAGVVAKPYARVARVANNARVLAKPGRTAKLVEDLNQSKGAPAQFRGENPRAMVRDIVGGQQNAYRAAVKRNKDVRRISPTAERWSNTFAGAKGIKSANPGKKVRAHEVVLRPRKVEDRIHRRIIDRSVEAAPKNPKSLYRNQPKGAKGDGTPASFSDSKSFADGFGDQKQMASGMAEMQVGFLPKKARAKVLESQGIDAATRGPRETAHVKPGTVRAVNIAPATRRTRQQEWIAKPVSKAGKLPSHIYHAGKKRRVEDYDPVTGLIRLEGNYRTKRGGKVVPKPPPKPPEQLTLFKRAKPLTDDQLSRRKRIQAHTSQAGSAAGLTSLGLLGASTVAGRRGIKLAPKLKNASTNAAIVGAGIGGASGFNFARIQSEEARRGQVKKGQAMKLVPIAKAYDPEGNRRKRQKGYTAALGAGSAGAAGYSGFKLVAAGGEAKSARKAGGNAMRSMKQSYQTKKQAAVLDQASVKEAGRKVKGSSAEARRLRGQAVTQMGDAKKLKVNAGALSMRSKAHLSAAKGHGIKSGKAAAGAAVLAGGAALNERHRRKGGQTYNGWWEHRY